MSHQVQIVPFRGNPIHTLLINQEPYVVVKTISDQLGLYWKGQYERIKRHPVLKTCVCVTHMQLPESKQQREYLCLPLSKLNGWLFGVNAARVKPAIRERLIQYQAECFDVLAGHFGLKPDTKAITSRNDFSLIVNAANKTIAKLHTQLVNEMFTSKKNLCGKRWVIGFWDDEPEPYMYPLEHNDKIFTMGGLANAFMADSVDVSVNELSRVVEHGLRYLLRKVHGTTKG